MKMKLAKDLLYTRNNRHLDIARLSALLSILAFWGAVLWQVGEAHSFDPMAVGGGCAAIMAGAAGWIYARQKKEDEDAAASDEGA